MLLEGQPEREIDLNIIPKTTPLPPTPLEYGRRPPGVAPTRKMRLPACAAILLFEG